jgi:uncharacterized membrane protein YeaQ/YmgE (transglycosylase-associated protein family)
MNQTVTVTFNVGTVLTWIIIGLIAGFLAGALVRGRRFGFITSVIIGLLGAIIGGAVFAALHITVPAFLQGELTIRVVDIVVAFVGAVILLLLLGLFYRYRR